MTPLFARTAGLIAFIAAWALVADAAAAASDAANAASRPVHRYLNVEISPDGALVASVEGDSPTGGFYPTVRELVIRRVRDGAATKIPLPCGAVPECWPGSPAWTPDGKRLAFALRSPGTHARSLYTVSRDGGALTKLMDFNGTLGNLRYAADGRLAVLATAGAAKETGATEAGAPIAGDLDAAPAEQRIAVLDKGALNWVSPPDLFVYEYDWRPDGKGFVGTAAPGDGDNNWWTAKLFAFAENESIPRRLFAPPSDRVQIASPRVSRDGKTVAFIGGIMSDFGSTGGDVYSVPLAGGDATDLTRGMASSATALMWTCDGRLLAKLLTRDKTQFADLGSPGRPEPARVLWSNTDTVGTVADGTAFACPSGAQAMEHESFVAAPEIEVGVRGAWHDISHENAGATLAAHVRSVFWQSDQYAVQGWLLLPDGVDGKMPMVTQVHGGPAAAAEPHFFGPGLVTTLVANGYAVFLPNPRGSFGQGEQFTLANVRDFGHGDLRDVLAGIDAVAKAAPIDPNRLGLTGGSYGGFMTMWAVTQTTRFKAAVAAAGISNWISYYGENGIDGWMLPYFGASAYDDPAAYEQSSAIKFMHNVRTPTFAWAGERDIECPPSQTQEFWHAMKAVNVPTSIMIYPGEGHGLRDPEHIADATRRTLAWFDRYLK